MSHKPPGKLVLIEWVDSDQPTGAWLRLSEFKPEGICQCVSVGFLIHDGEDIKIIAPNLADVTSEGNQQVSGTMSIPTVAIKRIVRLTYR